MKIIFNRLSNIVTGVNREPYPFEFSIELNDTTYAKKTVKRKIGKSQKKSENGDLLYKDNVSRNNFGKEIFDEVTYRNKPTEFEYKTVNNISINKQGEETREQILEKIATSYEQLEPVMIDNTIEETISLDNNPFQFTYEEVLEAKKRAINNNRLAELIFYCEDFEPNSISTSLSSHSADIYHGEIILHPNGLCRLEKIRLPKTITSLEVYSEMEDGIDIEIGISASSFKKVDNIIHELDEPTNSIYIRFKNTTSERKKINAIGILA